MMRDDGGPAFPAPDASWEHFGNKMGYTGMSLRDHFAGLAMQSMTSDMYRVKSLIKASETLGHSYATEVAIQSYVLADAMLREGAK
mgnify:CR=1 FL=1